MLLESLRSKLMLYPPPNHKVYKDSFFRDDEIAEKPIIFFRKKNMDIQM